MKKLSLKALHILNVKKEERKTKDEIIRSQKLSLNENLVQIFGSSSKHENAEIINHISQGASKGVCAKQLHPGDVAWRCMDCEKDQTCIICKDCFEKGDHTGHRVQLKRNVGGCCDCGDPEAWDENHFCSDHKGQHNIDPKELLKKMPNSIRNSAEQVFLKIAKQLKHVCMRLQNYSDECEKDGMSDERFKETMIECIDLIFQFLRERIEECPQFIYIIDIVLNKVFVDPQMPFLKNEDHKKCCLRFFPPGQEEYKIEYEKFFDNKNENQAHCSCTTLDLCMQTNLMLTNETRKVVYDFCFKMFQSYRFKQYLTLSFASNYMMVVQKSKDDENEISSIGVQVLTSDEMSMLICRNPELHQIILDTLDEHINRITSDQKNQDFYYQLFVILHDIKYMARPECLKYCIEETDFIEKLIKILGKFYFIDVKKNKNTLVAYVQEGAINERLLNLELYMIKVVSIYLREVPVKNVQKNKKILLAFYECFKGISDVMHQKHIDQGFYNLPVHRIFAYYFTRLILFSKFEQSQNNDPFNFQFNQILEQYLSVKDQSSENNEKVISNNEPLKNEFQGSSLIEDENTIVEDKLIPQKQEQISVKDFIVTIILPQIKALSFVHEIISRKWVYLGEYLTFYPRVYYKMTEELLFQDYSLFQMLLCFDQIPNQLDQNQIQQDDNHFNTFDFLIDNFGVDSQLSSLISGLIKNKINKEDLFINKKLDEEKLRLQLTTFLKFIIQICITEVPFLKQIFNKREEKAEKNHHIKSEQSQTAKQIWQAAVKKEAVHTLLLNKVNTSIEGLKESMVETLLKDEVFQNSLFEVSVQSRDKNNQVTFKLKDEFYSWFDPFQYIQPDQQSQIYIMYEQNQMKDKGMDKGINDVVGDYMGNYRYATNVNRQLVINLMHSKILKFVIPLLIQWLKGKHQFTQEKKNEEEPQDNSEENKSNLMLSKIFTQIKAKSNTSFCRLLGHVDIILPEEPQKDQQNYDLLNKLIDANLAHHCLKILVIIINCFFHFDLSEQTRNLDQSSIYKVTEDDKQYFMQEILRNNGQLIIQLIEYKNQTEHKMDTENTNQNQQDGEIKMNKLLTYILEKIYLLDSQNLIKGLIKQENADELRFNPENQIQSEIKKDLQKQKSEDLRSENKEKLKRRQSKLIQKLKNKGQKYIDRNIEDIKENEQSEVQKEEECHQCAYCQEDLLRSNFLEKPFGNFGFVQTTKLLVHSSMQTVQKQIKALRSQDLSQQFQSQNQEMNGGQEEELKVQTSHENNNTFQEFKNFVKESKEEKEESSLPSILMIDDWADSSNTTYKTFVPNTYELTQILTDLAKNINYVNPKSGSGSVITSCKHFSHMECLKKYCHQQETSLENLYRNQIFGFNEGEFACPICKSLNNMLIPIYSFREQEKVFLQKLQSETDSDGVIQLDQQNTQIINFFIEFLSQLVQKQTGFLSKKSFSQVTYKFWTRSLLMQDLKTSPKRILMVFNHIIHRIFLIDVKGLRDFKDQKIDQQIILINQSMCSLMRIIFIAKSDILDKVDPEQSLDEWIKSQSAQILNSILESNDLHQKQSLPFFSKNILMHCFKMLLMASFYYSDPQKFTIEQHNQAIDYLVIQFYNLLRIQFVIATYFRKNYGELNGKQNDVMKQLSPIEIVLFEQSLNENEDLEEIYCQVQLPVLRKLLVLSSILKASADDNQENVLQYQKLLGDLSNQQSDNDELQLIKKHLGIDQSDESKIIPFKNLFFESKQENVEMEQQDHLLELKGLIGRFSEHQFICDQLLKFTIKLTENSQITNQHLHTNNEMENKIIKVQMPVILLLMTPYFDFNFFEIPKSYMNLQTEFYKKKCEYCQKEVLDTATCLLCGHTICWFKLKSRGVDIPQCRVSKENEQDQNEGLICWHTKYHEGGSSIYLHTSSGRLLFIQNGSCGIFDSVYRNRYGELSNDSNKNYLDYQIDEQGGGLEYLAQVRKKYMNFQIGNEILQQRTNPDSKYKVYMKNAL